MEQTASGPYGGERALGPSWTRDVYVPSQLPMQTSWGPVGREGIRTVFVQIIFKGPPECYADMH